MHADTGRGHIVKVSLCSQIGGHEYEAQFGAMMATRVHLRRALV